MMTDSAVRRRINRYIVCGGIVLVAGWIILSLYPLSLTVGPIWRRLNHFLFDRYYLIDDDQQFRDAIWAWFLSLCGGAAVALSASHLLFGNNTPKPVRFLPQSCWVGVCAIIVLLLSRVPPLTIAILFGGDRSGPRAIVNPAGGGFSTGFCITMIVLAVSGTICWCSARLKHGKANHAFEATS
jgi:hypothetical protein